MFERSGEKIKVVSIILFVLMIIGSLVGMIILCTKGLVLYGFLTLIGGVFLSWVTALFAYGFGELIERTTRVDERLYTIQQDTLENKAPTDTNTEEINTKESVPTKDRTISRIEEGVIYFSNGESIIRKQIKNVVRENSNIFFDYYYSRYKIICISEAEAIDFLNKISG